VLDVSTSLAGNFCSRLFADFGAEVTLVEPPGGSPLRRQGPYYDGSVTAEDSILFWHLNTCKMSATIDLSTASGAEVLRRLVRRSQALVADDPWLAEELSPEVDGHTCLITDFAPDGPYARWRSDELVQQALGGSMYVTGEAGREPLYGFGERAAYAAGVAAYISLLVALLAGRRPRQLARIVTHEVVASMGQNFTTQLAYSGVVERRGENRRPRALLRCADGWAVIFVMPGNWPDVCAGLDRPDLAGDGRFAAYPDLVANWHEASDELARTVRAVPVKEVVAALAPRGIVTAAVRTPSEMLADPDMVARGFPESATGPDGPRRVLGPVARISGHTRQTGAAPRLGEHTAALLAEVGVDEPALDALRWGGVL
jgi:crotonobetainyl-CoA:carnitine CoA-transferase CaiB-like acyl-CoA transferase